MNRWLEESVEESGILADVFPWNITMEVKFNEVIVSHGNKKIELFKEDVIDLKREGYLARLVCRKAESSDLLYLKEIFEENWFKNNGNLFCEEPMPNKDNIDMVYVISSKGDMQIPLAYATLTNEVHDDMLQSDLFSEVNFKKSEFIYLKQLAVCKSEQGKGIGTMLIDKLVELYQGKVFYSHVSVENISSLKLHYRCGFQKIGIFQVRNFRGSDKNYISDFVYRDAYNM